MSTKRLITIWMEGYAVTGGKDTAQIIASRVAESFEDAIAQERAKGNLNIKIDEQGTPSIWGCRLFDNETDARKSFG